MEKIERLKDKLYQGMRAHGITGEIADQIYARIEAFASFGFAESHALSFALLVYASSRLKLHYPGAFLAGLLRAQPMGFYSPQSLVADARHHGVETRRPDITISAAEATLEPVEPDDPVLPGGMAGCLQAAQPLVPTFDPDGPDPTSTHRRDGRLAVRLGLTAVAGLGDDPAARIITTRSAQPFASIADVMARADLSSRQAEQLATAGTFAVFGRDRRQDLWLAGYPAKSDQLDVHIDAPPPTLPAMTELETTMADLHATKVAPEQHPFAHYRPTLTEHGIRAITTISRHLDRRRITVGGHVTHRQRPGTAGGSPSSTSKTRRDAQHRLLPPVWQRYRRTLHGSNNLLIRGLVEWGDGALNLVADKIAPLTTVLPATQIAPAASRDFR